MIEDWEGKRPDVANEDEDQEYYERVGRLKERLQATRDRMHMLRETRDDWDSFSEDIDWAISDLEEAIRQAAPRPQ